MKLILKVIVGCFVSSVLLSACRNARYAGQADVKDLSMLIRRLEKRGGDPAVITDIRTAYNNGYQKGMDRLSTYYSEVEPGRWDRIVPELEGLQQMHDIIARSAYAMRQVKPGNLRPRIAMAKDSAAAAFYEYGLLREGSSERSEMKVAFQSFQRAAFYVADYRDTKNRMSRLFEAATADVLVNPVQYDAFGMNNWNWNQFNNRYQLLNDQMVRDLGGVYVRNIPARFYTEWELRRTGKAPQLVVDLLWRNIRFDQPLDRTRSYVRTRQVEKGRDTANRPIFQTITATVMVTERMLNVDADLQILIVDAASRRQLQWDQVPANFRYVMEFADYSGDRSALQQEDWILINRSRNQPLPSQEDAFTEMLRQIYNDVLNRIRRGVDW